jgi:hypothetical protein
VFPRLDIDGIGETVWMTEQETEVESLKEGVYTGYLAWAGTLPKIVLRPGMLGNMALIDRWKQESCCEPY